MSKSKFCASGPDLQRNVKAKQEIVGKASTHVPGKKCGGAELVKVVK